MKNSDISADAIARIFSYDHDSGKLFWKTRPLDSFPSDRSGKIWNTRFSGKEVGGHSCHGYKRVNLKGRFLFFHRIAYAVYYGSWPKGEIDHINGVKTDNRISNLKDVSHSENMKNVTGRKNNSSGINGVSWHRKNKKWCSYVRVDGKLKHLGSFDSLEAATKSRIRANEELNFSDRHGAF